MKKIMSMLLGCLLFVSLTACEGGAKGKPADMNEGAYKIGLKVLEITDKVLNYDLTAKDALTQIDSFSAEIDKFETDTSKEGTRMGDSDYLALEVTFISHDMLMLSYSKASSEDYDDLQASRHRLAKVLGEPYDAEIIKKSKEK